jgi:aminopeptidase
MKRDPRIDKMARIVTKHALKVQPGDKVLIDATDECDEFIIAALEAVSDAGGISYTQHQSLQVRRAWLMGATTEQFDLWCDQQIGLRKQMDCIISLRAQDNSTELTDVPSETLRAYSNLNMKMGLEARKPGRRSTVIRYPSRSLAQQCEMSLEGFTDFFYKVCGMNFEVLHREMVPLKDAVDAADQVRIVAPDTDLSFSINDLECGISAGTWNIPDGETAMGIVRESVNGRIAYNIPSNHQGFIYRDIALTFKDGKVIGVEAEEKARVEAILDTDGGARYIGEFAIGVNPYLTHYMIDTLFDEKMAGSLHFTPAGIDDDGNRSYVHWDIIQSHLDHYGGGEIYFDGKLWRKNGMFTDEKLSGLNPDALRATLEKSSDWME